MQTDVGVIGTHLDERSALVRLWEATTTTLCAGVLASPPPPPSAALAGPHAPLSTMSSSGIIPRAGFELCRMPSASTKPAYAPSTHSRTSKRVIAGKEGELHRQWSEMIVSLEDVNEWEIKFMGLPRVVDRVEEDVVSQLGQLPIRGRR